MRKDSKGIKNEQTQFQRTKCRASIDLSSSKLYLAKFKCPIFNSNFKLNCLKEILLNKFQNPWSKLRRKSYAPFQKKKVLR